MLWGGRGAEGSLWLRLSILNGIRKSSPCLSKLFLLQLLSQWKDWQNCTDLKLELKKKSFYFVHYGKRISKKRDGQIILGRKKEA